jgi:hypothetical protein
MAVVYNNKRTSFNRFEKKINLPGLQFNLQLLRAHTSFDYTIKHVITHLIFDRFELQLYPILNICKIHCLKSIEIHIIVFKAARLQTSKIISRKSIIGQCTNNLRKVKTFKIQVILFMLCKIKACFCSIFLPYSTALQTQ